MAEDPMGDLVISGAPGRTGKYLYIQRGSVMSAIARFQDEKAVSEFINWCRLSSGSRIVWTGSEEG